MGDETGVVELDMRILGIDPGTGRTGWAVIEKDSGREQLVAAGCIETPTDAELSERLVKIFRVLSDLVAKHKPDQAAVEDLFFSRNVKTAMSVAQARGVVLLAIRLAGIPVASYTPPQIKSAVTGSGRADKASVEKMVSVILKIKESLEFDDTADAMAVALTHAATVRGGRTC